jgi:hypothetical protein
MASRTTTYRAILIGLAILIVAFVVYFIYIGLNSVLHFSSSSSTSTTTTTKPVLNPIGSQQQIQENAPISNVPASGSSQYNVVPVNGSGSSSSNGASGGPSNNAGSGSSGGSKNPCPDYLGDQKDCVQSNYTIYGPK